MWHIFQQSEIKIIKQNLIPHNASEPIIDLERTIAFIFYFFLKVEPIIRSSGRLILITKSLLLLVKQIFRLVEISFRNRLFLCVATVTVL